MKGGGEEWKEDPTKGALFLETFDKYFWLMKIK